MAQLQKIRVFLLVLLALAATLFAAPKAYAVCTNPDGEAGEVVYATDDKVFQYCNNTDWIKMHAPGTGSGGCTDPSRSDGVIVYNGSVRTLQACAGSQWKALGPKIGSSVPVGCPDAGDLCSDGSYFLGVSPDDGANLYMTSIAHESLQSWNNGTASYSTTGFTSTTDGDGNTAGLVALVSTDSPYNAAVYCDGLSAHGHSSGWYLPAVDELDVIWNAGSPLGDIKTNGDWYQSSTENNLSTAFLKRFDDGFQGPGGKSTSFGRFVRCVRKLSPTTPPPVPSGCSAIGAPCDDGTVYAGLSPDGNRFMYTTPADGGSMAWNADINGGWVQTFVTDGNAGETNTDALAVADSHSVLPDVQPHLAAQFCAGLEASGYTDWFLPAVYELQVLYNNQVAIGGFNTSETYWSSTEGGADNLAFTIDFGSGTLVQRGKDLEGNPVRCVRTHLAGEGLCSNPERPAGTMLYNAGANAMQYCDGVNWARIGPPPKYTPGAFVVVYDTTVTRTDGTAADEVLIKTGTGAFNYDVSWTDSLGGTGSATGLTGDYTITGLAAGEVTVEITGTFPHFNGDYANHGIVDVAQWGTQAWGSMAAAFASENSLVSFSAVDTPDLSNVTDMSEAFAYSSTFNADIGAWDVSNVQNMFGLFQLSDAFNQDIGGWDTSSLTDPQYMFQGALAFNQDIGGWDMSSVTLTNGMFIGADTFNQDIGGWDMSSVTWMPDMFHGAIAFNQDISGWDVSNVENFSSTFRDATAFNQDISGWDTSSATFMNGTFANATTFNQDLSPWCVSGIGSLPSNFDNGASAWTGAPGTRPQWGTCPAQTPDAFSFTDQTGVALSTQIESNIIQITGLGASAATSISGGGAEYRICTDGTSDANCDGSEVQTWTTGASTIDSGEYVQLRLTSSGSGGTMVSTTMTIGTGSDQWDVTTVADNTPDAFSFTDVTNQPLSALIESNIVQIVNMDDGTAISISGGSAEYRICTDGSSDANCDGSETVSWTSGANTIDADDYVQLRLTSSASLNTMVSTTLTIGTASDQWDVTTVTTDPCAGSPSAGDVCQDGSIYIGQIAGADIYATSAASESTQTWNNGTTNWTVTGATSTGDGAGNSAILVASADAGSPYDAADYCDGLINVHGNSDWHLPAQDELNLFWNGGTPVASILTDGTYYWASNESSNLDARVQRFSTGSQGALAKNNSRAVRCVRAVNDDTPVAFNFNDQTGVALSTTIESNILQITGITGFVATSISGNGGEYRICTNGTSDANCDGSEVQTWTTGAATIQNNQYIQLRQDSSGSFSTMVSTTLTIGTANDQWDVTTVADTTPNAFSFTDQTDVAVSTTIESNIIQITGMDDGTATSISGGGASYRICTNGTSDANCDGSEVQTWTTGAATIDAGDYIQLRMDSSGSNSTMVSTTMTIGSGSDQWDVTTIAAGPTPCPSGTLGGGDEGCVMHDGSVYAGDSPDGGDNMFTTPADGGAFTWNNGLTNYTTTGTTSTTTGESNTATLIVTDSDNVTGGTQQHVAAQTCADLSAHGYTDWYLPAESEVTLMRTNSSAIGGFVAASYWTSTELSVSNVRVINFPGGDATVPKESSYEIRCVRKGDNTPNAFAFTDTTSVPVSTLWESDIIQISGMDNGTTISITGDGSPQYRVCSTANCSNVNTNWTSALNTLNNNRYVQVRLTSNASNSTANSATLTIGSVSDQWSVTTVGAGQCATAPKIFYSATSAYSYSVPANCTQVSAETYGAAGGGSDGTGDERGGAGGGGGSIVRRNAGSVLLAVGGGGGGGGGCEDTNYNGTAGGGGGFALAVVSATGGEQLDIWVGSGGATPNSDNGGAGGAVSGGSGGSGTGGNSTYGGGGGGERREDGGNSTYGGGGGGGTENDGGDSTWGGAGASGDDGGSPGSSTNGGAASCCSGGTWGDGGGGGGFSISGSTVTQGSAGGAGASGPGGSAGSGSLGSTGGNGLVIIYPDAQSPGAFSFNDQTNVYVVQVIESNIVQIGGITGYSPVSISGGSAEFRICTNGTSDANCDGSVVTDWRTGVGAIQNNQYVQLRLTSSASNNTMTSTTLTIGTDSDQWDVTTLSGDSTPDAFSFNDLTAVAKSTTFESNIVQITGITTSTYASVSGNGASFRICTNGTSDANCDGSEVQTWTTSPALISNNQYIQLSMNSSGSDVTMTSTVLTVGPVTDQWDLTTNDNTPVAFNFNDQTGVALSTTIESNILQITGITGFVATSISGNGGEYRICTNGTSDANCDGSEVQTWTTGAATIQNNQYIQVRQDSSGSDLTMVSTTLTVGTVSDQWDVTTQDATPVAFSFTDVTDQPLNWEIASDSVNITGITGDVTVSVSGAGSPEVRVNGGSWTSGPTTIQNGQTLEVRLTTASASNTMRSATVTVGTESDQWDVTTKAGPAGCPDPGDVCANGSVYAGVSVDGNEWMFATPADAPGGAVYAWGPTANDIAAIPNCTSSSRTSSAASCSQGEANTASIVAEAAAHDAGDYCDSLSAHNQGDWYLPSSHEMWTLVDFKNDIGGFNSNYWSSSENGSSNAVYHNITPGGGGSGTLSKSNTYSVRCVRKGQPTELDSFTFVTSGTGSGTTITIPGTPTSGDICIIWNAAGGSGGAADDTPAGFTKLSTIANSQVRNSVFVKKLTGGETTVTGLDGTGILASESWIVATFRPNVPFTSFSNGMTPNTYMNNGVNPPAQTITSSGETTPIILFGMMAETPSGNDISPRSISPAIMSELNNGTKFYAHYKLYNHGETPVDVTYDMDDETALNSMISGYLTITE